MYTCLCYNYYIYFVLEKEWCGIVISLFHQAEVSKRMLLDLFSASFYKMRVNLGVLLNFNFDHLKTLDFTNPMHMF